MAGLWPPIFFCHRYKTTVSAENKLSSGGVCHKLKARTFRNVGSGGGKSSLVKTYGQPYRKKSRYMLKTMTIWRLVNVTCKHLREKTSLDQSGYKNIFPLLNAQSTF